ncbi:MULTISPECIES: sulfotransferase family protein [Nocardiopsis]|uniref:Sulfotransferase n=2 Tax=Nocardiopsis alba TaxID=53437 RepID=A0A7K2IXB2_9ACTN|nr:MULTISPECIES: sulfotransferase [Nocardiopsis]AFR07536.1 sulfotransferase family protein [Nocardiopsis alba ATCC BAA-2165]MEC3891994.1 sulfotransferase [Nocardiopsis sp. LDBS1602]MYR34630.1 sulfotransferase [Nocardiopsis alba]
MHASGAKGAKIDGIMKQQPSYILVVNGTKVQRPVFVLGAPHSGVPVIARALSRAPGFHLGAGSPGVLNTVYAVARRPSLASEKVAGTASLFREAYAETWHLTPLTCPRCPGPGARIPANASAEPCEHSAEAVRYGDASPDLLYSASALHAAFPDALFVQVIRDGRDVVADMMEDERSLAWLKPSFMKLEHEFPNHFFGLDEEADLERFTDGSTATKCAMRWRGAVRMSARLRRELGPEQLLTLRYEDVHGGEVKAAGELRRFTGARVSASELLTERAWGVGSWRERLSRSDHGDVHEVARNELSRLGYR